MNNCDGEVALVVMLALLFFAGVDLNGF